MVNGTIRVTCNPYDEYSQLYECPSNEYVYDAFQKKCLRVQVPLFEEQELDNTFHFFYGMVYPSVAFVSIVVNALVLYELHRKNIKRITVDSQLCATLSSILTAVPPFLFSVYYYSFLRYQDLEQTIGLCLMKIICMEILPFFFHYLQLLFTLMHAVQRCIVVYYPLKADTYCSPLVIRTATCFIVVYVSVMTLLRAMAYIPVIHYVCLQPENSPKAILVPRCYVNSISPVYSNISETLKITTDIFLTIAFAASAIPMIIKLWENSSEREGVHRQRNTVDFRNVKLTLNFCMCELVHVSSIVNFFYIHVFYTGGESSAFVYWSAIFNLYVVFTYPIFSAINMLISENYRVSLRGMTGWKWLAADEEMLKARRKLNRNRFSINARPEYCNNATRTISLPATSNRPHSERRRKITADLDMCIELEPLTSQPSTSQPATRRQRVSFADEPNVEHHNRFQFIDEEDECLYDEIEMRMVQS